MSLTRTATAGAVIATICVLAIAQPAAAHDQLLGSTPSADERLDAVPQEITLQFSGDLLALDGSSTGAVVLVVDADGTDWAAGSVTIDGDTVTAALQQDMPDDTGYEVRWQVVSEDGHPIAGVVPFVVGDGEPLPDTATAAPGDLSAGDEQVADQAATEDAGVLRIVGIGVAGAAAAVGVFLLITLLRRRAVVPATGNHNDNDQTQNEEQP